MDKDDSRSTLVHAGRMTSELIRLDPAAPPCWESVDTLRFGFERAEARLKNPSPAEQRLIVMLRRGILPSEVAAASRKAGLATHKRRELLDRLAPVLQRLSMTEAVERGAVLAPPAPRCAVLGEGWFAERLAHRLAMAGISIVEPEDRPALAVLVEHFLAPAERARPLLIAEVAHLPVRLTDRSMRLGPVVLPGGAPCLTCVELHGSEEEPLAAALAAQLTQQRPAAACEASVELCALLVRHLLEGGRTGEPALVGDRVRYEVHAGVPRPVTTHETVPPHPECGCVRLAEAA